MLQDQLRPSHPNPDTWFMGTALKRIGFFVRRTNPTKASRDWHQNSKELHGRGENGIREMTYTGEERMGSQKGFQETIDIGFEKDASYSTKRGEDGREFQKLEARGMKLTADKSSYIAGFQQIGERSL